MYFYKQYWCWNFFYLSPENPPGTTITDQEIGERFENLAGRKATSMQKSNVITLYIIPLLLVSVSSLKLSDLRFEMIKFHLHISGTCLFIEYSLLLIASFHLIHTPCTAVVSGLVSFYSINCFRSILSCQRNLKWKRWMIWWNKCWKKTSLMRMIQQV